MKEIIYRIKNKPGYKYLGVLILIAIIFMGLYYTDPVRELKNNPHEQLVCVFRDGYKTVPKNMIVGYNDDRNVWVFKNGYSHDCTIVSQ